MTKVYVVLLALIALIGIVFNRFAVEEAYRYRFLFFWRPPVIVARVIVVFSSVMLLLLALLVGFEIIK